jgi:hypothetical protein
VVVIPVTSMPANAASVMAVAFAGISENIDERLHQPR